jgi:hypothetical protein
MMMLIHDVKSCVSQKIDGVFYLFDFDALMLLNFTIFMDVPKWLKLILRE